ncbi:hypothetical protein D0869_03727 [Hortaea werneckii]|uniref:chitin synthase n=1 Tax=Hortaea werneckii TaxID=91943 RepID=A0A3M6X4M3_HORWE|nr:hypothetical protein D0869_03727 [Hortaea werneckii]
MASNNPWGYGPPPGYPGEDDGTPSGPQSHNGSTMRLLTNSDEPEYAQPTPTRSPYNPFASPEDYQRPNPVQADDSDISSLLRDVESDLSSNPRPSAPRTKTAKVRFKNKDKDSNVSSVPSEHPSPLERTYDPADQNTSPSRQTSVLDNAPQMPPPTDMPAYMPYRPSSRGSSSPTRPLSPLRNSADYARPPASSNPYEPADINGAPRPGTPSTQNGGSPRRPLPPQPLFAAGRPPSFDIGRGEEADMTSIPIDGDEDPFGPPTRDSEDTLNGEEDEQGQRPGLKQHDSFVSQSTFTDSLYDEKDEELYGPAPSGKQARRGVREAQMSKKEVQLINGELILECKIPTILYSFLPRRDDVEFTHMRYTAVTCDPDDFVDKGYKLRQNIGSTSRETELLICITMYNENEVDFTRTMHGVMRNIAHFCSRAKSRTWGKDGWQKIVVCIISDGRGKVHPRTLDAIAAMGCYQSGIAKNQVNQRDVTAHVYEYTTQVSLDSDLKFKGAEKGIVPCQMIFCLKEKNLKKLNSHRWLFNAIGQALNPNVCILLDVGTRPGDDSLYHLWKAFDRDSTVAGAAGEIKAAKGKAWSALLNPLVASQNFEYKMSNILDKPLESVFGYISVLPGALSAYRFHALQNDETGHGPLSQYFKGETLHGQDADVFTANMYLAEDRILCWELVAKRNERWVLKYVKNATGETDVPDAVPEFISQRRRWLNGAFFAAVYGLLHFKQVWMTDHTLGRKFLLHIEFIYQFIQLLFTFFSLGNFYLTFYFVAGSLADDKIDPFGHHVGRGIFIFLRYCCVLCIMMQFVLSMGNRPQGAKKMFLWSMVTFSVIMAYTTFASIYIVVIQFTGSSGVKLSDSLFMNMVVSILSTIGLYFIMSFLYLDPWHMFTSSAQYFMLLPSYLCTLQVYAFCNAHDVSWGTKGDNIAKDLGVAKVNKNGIVEVDMPSEQLDIDSGYDEALRNLRDRIEVPSGGISESQAQEDYYRAVRTYVVIVWLTCNAILAMAVSEVYGTTYIGDNIYLKFILWSVAILALFRAIGSGTFLAINVIHAFMEGKLKIQTKRDNKPKGPKLGGGWRSKLSTPSWVSSTGSWMSSKASSWTPSSIGSSLGR